MGQGVGEVWGGERREVLNPVPLLDPLPQPQAFPTSARAWHRLSYKSLCFVCVCVDPNHSVR